MNEEYQKNQKEQKSLFKKYRSAIKKYLLGIGLGITGLFILPYIGISELLTGIGLSESLTATISVFTRIGLTIAGLVTAGYQGVKAYQYNKKLNNSMNEEEGLVEAMHLSSSKKDEKINELEKALSEEKNNIKEKNIPSKKENNTLHHNYKEEEKANVKIK